MKSLGLFIVFIGVFTQVQSSRISLDDDAQAMCKKYKMICKTGKICAVQHFDYPNNVTFPVCIPLSFVPDEYNHVVRNMICELQPLPGPCGARYIRWYYNRHAQECAYFRYGGCQGNQNNFKSKSDCESACMSVPTISLYKGSQSSLSAIKPAIRTEPIYEPPEVKYEALNSIRITGNEQNYDTYSATRYRKMQNDDDSNTRKRRRLEKERAKERRRKEKRKERKRLKRLRRRQRKLLREGKKPKKDRKKKKKTKAEDGVRVTDIDNTVTTAEKEHQVNTVEEISNIVDNAISDEDSEQKRRREERRKRRKKRQKRPKKDKDGRSKKQKRDNKYAERQVRRHAPSHQNDDAKSYRMLSILDHIANSKSQSGSIAYTEH